MKGKPIKIAVVIIDLLLLFALIASVVVIELRKDDSIEPAQTDEPDRADDDAPVIFLDGKSYRAKPAITATLLLGIDSNGEMKSSGSNSNGAKSDFVCLLIHDSQSASYSLLHLNRDTMTEVPRIGIGGATFGSSEMQLALAYTYGDGMKQSCENSVAAVENLLYGIEIDSYFAINMSGLVKLIDSLGGVTATVHGDFSKVDSRLVDGKTLHMDGALCLKYLRGRYQVGSQTNIERAERQRVFIDELLGQLGKNTKLSSSVTAVADYVVTDMNASELSKLYEQIEESKFDSIVTPDGEVDDSGEHVEFYVDDTALRELVIELFYELAE